MPKQHCQKPDSTPTPKSMRPYIILKFAVTLDGFLDDSSSERLLISSTEDFERVDEVRASCDAILVGAETVRKDNPRLLIRGADLRAARVAQGLPEHPVKVTLTRSGALPANSAFFTQGSSEKLVYCTSPSLLPPHLPAQVVALSGDTLFESLLADLVQRGIKRLLVEGGSMVIADLLQADLFDELQVSVGNLLLGGGRGVRAFGGLLSESRDRHLLLEGVEQLGETVLLTYRPN